MQIKTAVRYHLTPVRMITIKKSTNNKCWRECGEKGAIFVCSLGKCLFRSSARFFFIVLLLFIYIYWVVWTVCILSILTSCQLHYLQIFSPISKVIFLLSISFAVQKLLSLIRFHLKIVLLLLTFCFERLIWGNIAMIYVRECFTYVLI